MSLRDCRPVAYLGESCPTCGAQGDAPGYLQANANAQPWENDFGKVVPCPTCHARRITRRLAASDARQGKLTGDLSGQTFDTYAVTDQNRAAYEACRRFAANPAGWITLCGGYGPGKSHLGAAIVNAVGDQALYYNAPDLAAGLQEDYGANAGKIVERICKFPVLVIDELDKANIPAGHTKMHFQRIFNQRDRESNRLGLVLIFNGNPRLGLPDELQFLVSRIYSEQYQLFELNGDNRPMRSKLRQLAAIQHGG